MLIFCGLSPHIHAQNEQMQINEVKKNLDFIYATGTSLNSAEEAGDNARELLALEIDLWLKENGITDYAGYVTKAVREVSEIKTQRGKLVQVFVYVKKSDVLSYQKNEEIIAVTLLDESSTPVNQRPYPPFELKQIEKDMLSVYNLSMINKYLTDGVRNGIITAYGKNEVDSSMESVVYLFLIDKKGDVIAAIKKDGNYMVNLTTGKEDAIPNYGKCGVIWFQVKE